MIMPSDKEYKATKLIMQGKESIKEEFKPLANWIDKTYGVKTINIIYDTMERGKPRLQICFELPQEKEKFYGENYFSFDTNKQQAISAQFKRILIEQGLIQKKYFFEIEGDQKLWVDGQHFPVEYGTGTEDYYNTSWAPVVLYQTPFANAPRADNQDSFGYNTFTRTRNLDAVPFKNNFRYSLEMLG